MKLRMKSATIWTISIILLAAMSLPVIAQSQTVHVSGTVRDNSAEPFEGAEIQIIDPVTKEIVVPSVFTDVDGFYELFVEQGTYDVKVIPSESSGFGPSITLGQVLTSNTTLSFVLVPAGVVVLSGRVLDPLGEGIPDQRVIMGVAGTGNWIEYYTDAFGNYYFEVTPGDYGLIVQGHNGFTSPPIKAPSEYYLYGNTGESLSLTESIVMDIPLPEYKVSVHVQDPVGNPVYNVVIGTNFAWNYDLTLGSLAAYGRSSYSNMGNPAFTDANGDVELWLFPTPDTGGLYTLTATPPQESPFATFNVYNVEVISDMTEVIVLDFVHPAPVTTASVSPAPNEKGVYPDPVTATLSATATEGFSIAWTYYSVDGGPLLVYTEPFVISGTGLHSIEYWSEDNIGVFELPKILNITINSPPIANAGPVQTVAAGDTVYLYGGGSSDPDSDPLSFNWSFESVPEGSTAEIIDPASVEASFVADLAGAYIVSLVVNDGIVDSETDVVTITAIPPEDAATEVLIDTKEVIDGLTLECLMNENLGNALINKIDATLAMIDEGLYEDALDKLQNDILKKTNGCAETGEPDQNDWIITCEEQGEVYDLVLRAIDLLQRLI